MGTRNWPKVEELYHAALAKDAAEREAFLDQACGGDSGECKVLVEDAADARYLPTGHLAFVRRGVLMAAPFDME